MNVEKYVLLCSYVCLITFMCIAYIEKIEL